MKTISLIITLIGIFFLLALPLILTPKEITSISDLEKLSNNQKLRLSSKVISETEYPNYKILTLENKIKIVCKPTCKSYKDKNITIIGQLDNFYDSSRVIALEIT